MIPYILASFIGLIIAKKCTNLLTPIVKEVIETEIRGQ